MRIHQRRIRLFESRVSCIKLREHRRDLPGKILVLFEYLVKIFLRDDVELVRHLQFICNKLCDIARFSPIGVNNTNLKHIVRDRKRHDLVMPRRLCGNVQQYIVRDLISREVAGRNTIIFALQGEKLFGSYSSFREHLIDPARDSFGLRGHLGNILLAKKSFFC